MPFVFFVVASMLFLLLMFATETKGLMGFLLKVAMVFMVIWGVGMSLHEQGVLKMHGFNSVESEIQSRADVFAQKHKSINGLFEEE